jgi:O-antigen/teichoic acid export membrane protein
MSGAGKILRNLTANWIGVAANLIVMFFLSPFIIHTLGVTEYGIWQLLTVLTGYMGILDLGVRASTGRHIMLYLGQDKPNEVDETIRTGFALYTILSLLILAAGIFLGLVFPLIFPSVPQSYHGLLQILLPILAVNIWISAVRVILSSILTAHERFDLARGSDLLALAIRTIGTIIVLKQGMGLAGLTAAIIGCNIMGGMINYKLARKIHVNLKLWPLILNKKRVKELYNYGIGAFIIAISLRIIGQTDLLLVGNLIHIDAVAVYSVGAMLIYYSGTFTKMIDTTFFPSLQKAVAANKPNEARSILTRQIQLSLIIGLLMYIGYFSFGKSFIRLWMFEPHNFPMASVKSAAQVMAILSCAKLLLLLGGFSRSILAATGYIGFAAKMTVAEAVVNLLLSISFVLIFDWGLIGIAAGTFGSHLIFQTVVVPHYACAKAGMNWSDIVIKTGSKGLIVGVFLMIICFYVQRFLPGESWGIFSAQVSLTVLLYMPFAWFFLIPKEDRVRIRNKFIIMFTKFT